MCLISGNPDFQAVSEPLQKKVTRLEPCVTVGGRSSLGQQVAVWEACALEGAAVGKGPPTGITRVCLASEEEGWSWTGRAEMHLQLPSLLGRQAESGWQECLGDSDHTEQGGFRSQIRFAVSLELFTCFI